MSKLIKDVMWPENGGHRLYKKNEVEIVIAANINTARKMISFQAMIVNANGQILTNIPFKNATISKDQIMINEDAAPEKDAYDNHVGDCITPDDPALLKLLGEWQLMDGGMKLSDIITIPK